MGQNQSAIDTSGERHASRYYYDTDLRTVKLSRKNDDRIFGVLDEPCSYKRMCAPGSPDSEEFSPQFDDSLELSLPLPGHYDSSLFGHNSSLSSTFPHGDIVPLETETIGSSKLLDGSCKQRNLRRPHQPSLDEEVPPKKAKDSAPTVTTKEAAEIIYDATPSRKSEKTEWKTPQPIATSTPLHASVKSKFATQDTAPKTVGENDRLPAAAMTDSNGATKIGTKLIQTVERILSTSSKWTPSKKNSSFEVESVPANFGKKIKSNAPPVPVRTTSLQKPVINHGFYASQCVSNQHSTSSSESVKQNAIMMTSASNRQTQKTTQPQLFTHLSDAQNYHSNQFVQQVEGTPTLSIRRPSFPQMGLTPRKVKQRQYKTNSIIQKTKILRAIDIPQNVPENPQMSKPILPILSRPLDVASETNRSRATVGIRKSVPVTMNATSSQSIQAIAASGARKPQIRMTTEQRWSQKDVWTDKDKNCLEVPSAEFFDPRLSYVHKSNNNPFISNMNMQMVTNVPSTLPHMTTDASACLYENLPVLSDLPSSKPLVANHTANATNSLNVSANRWKTSRLSLPARFPGMHNPQPLPPPYRPTMMYKQMLAVSEQHRSINGSTVKPNYGVGGAATFAPFPPSYAQLLI